MRSQASVGVVLIMAACAGLGFVLLLRVPLAQAQHNSVTRSGLLNHEFAFIEDFDGTILSPARWNTSIATSGNRWCDVASIWFDPEISTCANAGQTAPFGTIDVSGGFASFGSGILACFPYVWCGPPSRPSPFPPARDFSVSVRIRYDALLTFGCGVQLFDWPDTDPIANNSPFPPDAVFGIWGDDYMGVRFSLFRSPEYTVAWDSAFHTFELRYLNGAYSVYVDNALMVGPAVSSLRPNMIWLGHPLFTGYLASWSNFTLDFIQVRVL